MNKKDILARLRKELHENARLDEGLVKVHRPWVIVEFQSAFGDNFDIPVFVGLWGVAKICWPDKWSKQRGMILAYNRALAWGAKKAYAVLFEDGWAEDTEILMDVLNG